MEVRAMPIIIRVYKQKEPDQVFYLDLDRNWATKALKQAGYRDYGNGWVLESAQIVVQLEEPMLSGFLDAIKPKGGIEIRQMTVRQYMHHELVAQGMAPEQATDILREHVATRMAEPMASKFDHDVTDFTPELIHFVWQGVKLTTLAWIDVNDPTNKSRNKFLL